MQSKNRTWLFYIVTALFWFSLYAYVPHVAPYGAYLGANLRLVGLIAGAYGFTQMVLRFPLGVFSDKIGRRKVFVIKGMGFAAAAGLVVYVFPNEYALLATRALGGVAASAWVTFTVLGAAYYPPEKTAKVMGTLSAYNAVGRMLALLIGGLFAYFFGPGSAFLLGGAAGAFGFLLSLGIKEKPPNIEPPTTAQLLSVAKNRQLISASVLGIFCMFISFATTFGFIPLAAYILEANSFQLGMLGVVSTVPGIFMAPLAGTVMPKKLGACATLVIGFLVAAAGSVLIPFANTLPHLFAVQIIGSIGQAILGTLLLGLCIHDIPAPRRATAMGFYQAVYGIGMFLGPFAMGQISYAFSLQIAFIFTGLVGIIGAVATVIYAKRGSLGF
jgi:MFS family permease